MQEKSTRTLLRGILGGGQARILMCDTTAMAQSAREIHHASNVCSAALGRAISAAALLSASIEEDINSLTLSIKGDGPAGGLVAVARERTIKAYIDYPETTLPLRPDGKLDVGGAIGRNGRLTVVRDLSLKEPYVGQCALKSGEIAEDVAYYYAISEQKPSLCSLGVLVNQQVLASAGMLVQPLPGCDEETIAALELRAPIFADISGHLTQASLDALFHRFFEGLSPEILDMQPLTYACDCSREKMERVLLSLGRDEINDIMETQHAAEITCHFCRTQHRFSETELQVLLDQA